MLVWIFSGKRVPLNRLSVPTRVWVAIIVVALGFAAAHIPKWLEIAPPTVGLMSSVVVLNGIGGVVFGYLFARFGIESAILSHFAANVV
jgi:membrane protease YdiL (CAAX protease family)